MKLSEFIDWLKTDVTSIANDDPEIKFAASLSKCDEVVDGEYDGVYENDDGSVTIDISFIK